MKKLIFGIALMLCGAICGTGWLVAHCCACVEPGALPIGKQLWLIV